jgi:hypothetical protein
MGAGIARHLYLSLYPCRRGYTRAWHDRQGKRLLSEADDGPFVRGRVNKEERERFDRFKELIMQELESGKAVRPEASTVPAEQVTEAALASLAEVGAS